MSQPLLGHLDPEFLVVMDQVQADLRKLFHTENPFTLPVSGTGSAGMEICLANLVEAGDRVVIGTHGVFGGRMRDLVERLGGERPTGVRYGPRQTTSPSPPLPSGCGTSSPI